MRSVLKGKQSHYKIILIYKIPQIHNENYLIILGNQAFSKLLL